MSEKRPLLNHIDESYTCNAVRSQSCQSGNSQQFGFNNLAQIMHTFSTATRLVHMKERPASANSNAQKTIVRLSQLR